MSEPLIRRINREQMLWWAVDVERLIGEDHPKHGDRRNVSCNLNSRLFHHKHSGRAQNARLDHRGALPSGGTPWLLITLVTFPARNCQARLMQMG